MLPGTFVDDAERELHLCRVNADGAAVLAAACLEQEIGLVTFHPTSCLMVIMLLPTWKVMLLRLMYTGIAKPWQRNGS